MWCLKLRSLVLVTGLCLVVSLPVVSLNDVRLPFDEEDHFEDRGAFGVLRLGRIVGEGRGLDSPGGNRIAVSASRTLWLARQRSLTEISFQRKTIQRYWFPESCEPATISSIFVSKTAVWIGLSDGRVALRRFRDGTWEIHESGNRGPQRIMEVAGSILAFSQESGGWVAYFHEAKRKFLPYFSLPGDLKAIPGSMKLYGRGWYLATDLGLFRIERPGTEGMRWEMQGTRDGLSLMTIHDLAPLGNRLLLASSVSQYPRLPRHIRLTSYGSFVFDYFQGVWKRQGEPGLSHFLAVNASNATIPANGLWVYAQAGDRARTVRGAEDEFFRVLPVGPETWLAAGARGLYHCGRVGQEYRAVRIVSLPGLWIDDLARDAERAYVLSGRSLYEIPLNGLKDAVLGSLKPDMALTNREPSERTNRQTWPQQVRPVSEEAAFVSQITRYLESLKHQGKSVSR